MKKILPVYLMLVSAVPLLGGCWNQRELTELAFVMAVGIDQGTGGKKYDVSFQVVVPANVATGLTGGSGQGPSVVVYKSSGNNLTEASRKATKQIPRELYYAHTSIVVISEELARKEGILDLLDVLDRDPEFRTTTAVIIAKGQKASDMISILTNLDKLPMDKFRKTLDATEAMLGENVKMNIDDIIGAITSPGREAIISGFILDGSAEKGTAPDNINKTIPPAMITADGLAVIKNGKLVGWLTNENSRGAIWLLNKMKGTEIDFALNHKKAAVSTTPYLSNTNIAVTFKNGKPVANISIETVFKLSEINTAFDIENPHKIGDIEKLTAQQIKKEVESSIKRTQKYRADIVGFGERLHRSNPKLWKKIKGNWNNYYAKMDYNIKVEALFRETGIRGNPFWMNINH